MHGNVIQPQMKTPYHELSQQLREALSNLNNLYREREAISLERETALEARSQISDDLLESRNDSKFAKALEQREQDLRKLDAILSALSRKIHSSEDQFIG